MSFINSVIQNIKRFTDRQSVYIIHNDDLEKMLTEINAIQDIRDKKVFCSICGRIITLENIACMQKSIDQILFFCDSVECMRKRQVTNKE